ncbi:MAG: hypothetical protein Q9177_006007 [Variospora cf. flavescens]
MQNEARHNKGSSSPSMGGMKPGNTSSVVIIGDHNPQCSIEEVESATAMLTLYGNLIAGILGAITAPFWGKLSDRLGRIKPLAAASTVILGSEVVMVLVAKMPDTISLNWIYLTYVLEGLSGTFILVMALASAYAADCTSASERNVALGWFHGSMFFGFAAGPVLGGYIGMSDGKSRPMLIFYIALVMRILGIAFLLLFVPESLLHRQARPTQSQAEPKSLRQTLLEKTKFLQMFTSASTANAKTRRDLIALAAVNTIMFGALMGAMNVMLLYSEYTFGWGNKESGIFLSVVNLFRAIASMVVLPLAIRWLRPLYSSQGRHGGFDRLDLLLMRTSILSDIVGYVGYAIAPNGVLFTVSGVVAAFGAIGLATSEASMTKLVGGARTGELLGALGFLQAMARIVAPTVANLVYSWTVARVPQLVFWGVAACFTAAGLATFWARPNADGDKYDFEDAVPLQAKDLSDVE